MAIKEKDGVEATIKTAEASHKAELATQAANLKQEMTEKISEAREKARLEGKSLVNLSTTHHFYVLAEQMFFIMYRKSCG